MTVTNAMGQQVNVTQAFYASPSLLAPGLQTFGVQAGLVRRNWGSVSNDYGKMAGAVDLSPRPDVEDSQSKAALKPLPEPSWAAQAAWPRSAILA